MDSENVSEKKLDQRKWKKWPFLGNFWAKIKKNKKNEPYSYIYAYLSISNLMNQSKTVKKKIMDSEGVCEKNLTTENGKNCHFWAILGKKSRKIRKTSFFHI